MARHVPDDFSFLPTVDSTDEDEIVENKELWNPKHPAQPPVASEPEDRAAAEPPPVEEPVHEEVVAEVPPPAPPVPAPRPQPAPKGYLFEPQTAPPAPVERPVQKERTPEPEPEPAVTPIAPLRVPKRLSKMDDEAPMPVPRAPQVVSLRADRQSFPVAAPTPLASLGGLSAAKKSGEPTGAVLSRGEGDTSSDKVESESEVGADSKPFIAPKPPPEEPLDPEEAKKKRWQDLKDKIGLETLGMSFVVHLVLLIIAAFIGVSHVMEKQVDFLPGGSTPQGQAASEALTHKIQNKKNPWVKAKPPMRKISVQSVSANIVLPEMPAMDMMDFSKINSQMNVSKAASMGGGAPAGMGTGGAGGGFGSGIGKGGKFTFLGQTAVGRRVIFVVDVSGSMSAIGQGEKISRFDLLKKELIKSISQIPPGTAYQVLFFSDFAWPHNEVDSHNTGALVKYRWEIDPKDYKRVKIPTFKYLQANPFSLQESRDIIQNADNPGGTNWGSGLLMALNANPKPDVIFFMTDGNRSDEMGWIDIITEENKRKQPMTVIHTSAMQQPDAARELDAMAKRNNGKFTVVLGEGKVVKGEDFFKMK